MKFIQPGAVRIATTNPRKAPANVAFRNPDGSIVLVAANPQSTRRPLSMSWRGEVLATTLPPKSVATLQWRP
ncbi:MAG: hypothetical protein FJ398_27100 [Verrucomicrobia bacterium]|nr:hypothetical protein [Verrucomicrobiota bacterium]